MASEGDSVPFLPKKTKRPKLEQMEGGGDKPPSASSAAAAAAAEEDEEQGEALHEQEEALLTLIDYRTKEVDHLRKRTNYYRSQLEEAETNLNGLHSKLSRLRDKHAGGKRRRSASHSIDAIAVSQSQQPQLLIPSLKPNSVPSRQTGEKSEKKESLKQKTSSDKQTSRLRAVLKKEASADVQSKDLIPSICTCSSPSAFRIHSSNHIVSQHNRRLRCLELNPSNDQLFCTSALDGSVNIWELQSNGSSASLLSVTRCGSLKGRWPEDLDWHPNGDQIFASYTADGGDSQVSILNLNASRDRVSYLDGKPHQKGIINTLCFMPWNDPSFTTGGCDHAVAFWHEKGNESSWKPEVLHRNLHSSAVNGIAGLQQKNTVLSVGADKRIIGFDVQTSRVNFKHQIESKCMSILQNPFDFNLFVVQTGVHGKQLRLFDIRLRQKEIHSFGWKQENSDSQSALINQSWSSDGFCLSSGSADPMIHIFDIRYKGQTPSQSVRAHQKRVFKAAWHRSLPLLISISSDMNVGLLKMQ